MATDNLGDVQPTPTGAQATTQLVGLPTSAVNSLPSTTTTTSFTVSWSGTPGPGATSIASYTIYDSEDGGPFTAFLTNTTLTLTTFTGAARPYLWLLQRGDRQPRRRPADADSRTGHDPSCWSTHQRGQFVAIHDHDPELHRELERHPRSGGDEHRIVHHLRFGRRRAVHGLPDQHDPDLDDLHWRLGHTYGFYSVATDNLGDVQSTPTGAQATTHLVGPVTSAVNSLPARTTTTSFTVSWSGTPGPGAASIASYTIYDSEDGGPFTAFLTDTTLTSTTFTGALDHTYGFYSVATDNLGDVQPTPTGAQATTQLVGLPTSAVNSLPSTTTTPSFTVSWSGTPGPGATSIASYTIYDSEDGGPFTAFLTNTTLTLTTFTGALGHTYGFYSVATDNLGDVQPTPSGAQATTTIAGLPTSAVSSLPATTTTTSFTVSWSGTPGPGATSIASYTIYDSEDGGPFTAFLTDTTSTSTTFTGGSAIPMASTAWRPTTSATSSRRRARPGHNNHRRPSHQRGQFVAGHDHDHELHRELERHPRSGGDEHRVVHNLRLGRRWAVHGLPDRHNLDLDDLHRRVRPYLWLLQRGDRQPRRRPADAERRPGHNNHRRPSHQRGQFVAGHDHDHELHRELERHPRSRGGEYCVVHDLRFGRRRAVHGLPDRHDPDLDDLHRRARPYLRLLQRGDRQPGRRPADADRRTGHDSTCRPAHQRGQFVAIHDHDHELHRELERHPRSGGDEHRIVHNLRFGRRRAVHGLPDQHDPDLDDLHWALGHTYGFYSVATDNLGDVQPTPSGAQATTTIAGLPTSAVSSLPATTTTPSFTVSWSGTPGPGATSIASYTIYDSEDGGPFTAFLTDTTSTSTTFTGALGHTYGFYSVATDNLGDVQPTPTGAQATTQLVGLPTSAVNSLPSTTTTTSFTVSWSGTPGPGATSIASYTIYDSEDGGPFTAFLTNTTLTLTTFTGAARPHLRLLQRGDRQPRRRPADAERRPGHNDHRRPSHQRGQFVAGHDHDPELHRELEQHPRSGGDEHRVVHNLRLGRRRAVHGLPDRYNHDLDDLHRRAWPYLWLLQRGDRQPRRRPADADRRTGHDSTCRPAHQRGQFVAIHDHDHELHRELERHPRSRGGEHRIVHNLRFGRRRAVHGLPDQHDPDLDDLHWPARPHLRLLQRGDRQPRRRPADAERRPGHNDHRRPSHQRGQFVAGHDHDPELHRELERHPRSGGDEHRVVHNLRLGRRWAVHGLPDRYNLDLDDLHRAARPYLRLLQRGDRQPGRRPADADGAQATTQLVGLPTSAVNSLPSTTTTTASP